MAARREKIIAKAIEILKSNPEGIRYSDLVRKIHEEFLEIPVNTIHGTVWNLETRVPNEIYNSESASGDSPSEMDDVDDKSGKSDV